MPHFAGACPFSELHFRYELRPHPGRHRFVLHLRRERRLRRLELDELAVKLFKYFVAEAGANMADIAPTFAVAQRERKRSEEWPGAPGSSEAGDDNFLAFRGFDLQPVVRPGA